MAYQDCEKHVSTVSDVSWVDVEDLHSMELAFDHIDLLKLGRERMKQRALYSISSGYALPATFTFAELQHLHEVLIGKTLQKRSFRRRIEQAELLKDAGEKRQEGGRPAALYSLSEKARTHTFIRNLES